MNARKSENYLAISRSSSASKSVEIFWADIFRGQLFLGPNLVSIANSGQFLYPLPNMVHPLDAKSQKLTSA
jgi:hypothetical protein